MAPWYLITIEDGEYAYEPYGRRPEIGIDTPWGDPWAIMNDERVIVDSGNGWGEEGHND